MREIKNLTEKEGEKGRERGREMEGEEVKGVARKREDERG